MKNRPNLCGGARMYHQPLLPDAALVVVYESQKVSMRLFCCFLCVFVCVDKIFGSKRCILDVKKVLGTFYVL